MADEFFAEREDQSEVKARIVSNYFGTWARIIAPHSMDDKIAYIDLFAGPGRYEDGSASTPLMILENAIANPTLRDALVSIFNDGDENHSQTLENEIKQLPDIEKLKHQPQIRTGEVGKEIAEYFESVKLIPTFSFIDPFGYKGLSSGLVRGVIKDWGSDCVFFFNYSRINAGISNPGVQKHMKELFGDENFAELRKRIDAFGARENPHTREELIMEHLKRAMIDAGAKYVQFFRFRNETGTRTTHHLIFVTKHPLGYQLMKEIMAKESSTFNQGVPSYEYSPAIAGRRTLLDNALDELEDDLVQTFAGRTISMIEIYREHNLGKPYIQKNYKVALGNLELAGRVTTDKPNRKAGTFADGIKVTFPERPKKRK